MEDCVPTGWEKSGCNTTLPSPLSSFGSGGAPGSGFLRNRYWILRHGRSIPNEKGLVVSWLQNGVRPEYGLAPTGFKQASEAGKKFMEELKEEGFREEDWTTKVHVVSSPFSRTLDTSRAVMQEFPVQLHFQVVPGLRERYFGASMELQCAHRWYPVIWEVDVQDYRKGPKGGESVVDVAIRMAGVMAQMERELEGCAILIVSHGDPLQIIQAACQPFKNAQFLLSTNNGAANTQPQLFDGLLNNVGRNGAVHLSSEMGKSLSRHRTFPLETAELRQLI